MTYQVGQIPQSARRHEAQTDKVRERDGEDFEELCGWCASDGTHYLHFVASGWKRVCAEGPIGSTARVERVEVSHDFIHGLGAWRIGGEEVKSEVTEEVDGLQWTGDEGGKEMCGPSVSFEKGYV